MKINPAIALAICGSLTTGAAIHYSDWILGCVGFSLALFAGYIMGLGSKVSMNIEVPK